MNFIGKLLPVEGYEVVAEEALPLDYAIALSHLYQPLIGIHAVSLFQTLFSESMLGHDAVQTHHSLMSYLNLPLDEIYQARLKLEGIGLLRTYQSESADGRIYTYRLRSPFSPQDFFCDAMLCSMLRHHLGDSKFLGLKEKLSVQALGAEKKDVTAEFADVYQPLEPAGGMQEDSRPAYAERGPVLSADQVDFSWLIESLKQRMLPIERILTPDNKRMIVQMAVLYELPTVDIEKALLWALSEEHVLDWQKFSNACHDLSMKSRSVPATAPAAVQPAVAVKEQADQGGTSKKEQLIRKFETMSPKQILEDFSNGSTAVEADLKMIRDVMVAQGLSAPVMNVLVHYVLLQTNNKLSKAYLEKIAGHWSRAKLKTAKEAFEFALSEQARLKQKKSSTSSSTYRPYQKNVKREIVPEWIKRQQPAAVTEGAGTQQAPNEERDRAEIANVLNSLINSSKK